MSGALKLPPGRTEAEALAVAIKWRKLIWGGAAGKGLDENARIDLLIMTCVQMLDGDVASGRELAKRAIWSDTPANFVKITGQNHELDR